MRELKTQLANISLNELQSNALYIDRDATGNSVSGYILCHNNKHEATQFTDCVLEYTSTFVEEKVEEFCNAVPLKKKIQTVLRCLKDDAVDVAGKNLEAVVTEFLSQGTCGANYRWEAKRAGTTEEAWSTFTTTTRTMTRLWDVSDMVYEQGLMLVSTNANFPLGDMPRYK